jgi:hypothetical protein
MVYFLLGFTIGSLLGFLSEEYPPKQWYRARQRRKQFKRGRD